ncbi:MATE family efflux transporter [Brachyspira hampsonii]|uniref:Multidrug export protein MepA n=1 Tax=Brachyspira hampsonii TaxID=1287055 RepID=A0AAC9TTR0_9SPIR|nr:MATE family efflux transporter [Brachyspira hampsonii]ASJ21646.1 MATE family efflux transporter [Brachyspira hampsonii]ELV05473.1 MATE efflux family protein [Brachyspira hampsonii 30599]MBW5381135.1 MATE family efflux transporter [Brachyspira hampsonii]MBW5411394.1 MATE family efflux transporter [Brachyspira hampsonii]OEJ12905.1 MATE family efflux transporter [Brachyspira hampsonii]
MTDKKIELFENYPVHKALMTLALPTILGMLVNVFYNMVDTFFVGKTGDPNQVAAVSLCMPIYLLLMAFGNIFGIGGGSYISRKLGAKDYESVKKISSFAFYASIIVGFISMAVYLIFMKDILKISGASPNTYQFSKNYLIIVAFGAPFVVNQMAMGQIVRAEGSSKEAMIGMMIGTVVNIVLDPIMILYMNMGVAGAALATIIGNACSTVYYIYHILRKKSFLSIHVKDFSLHQDILINVFSIGIPVSINNILMSASNILINNLAAGYSDNVVAGLGVAQRIFTLVILVFIGLSQGLQPFVGYNFASKNYKRMNSAIKISCVVSVVIGCLLLGLSLIFGRWSVGVFINNEEVIDYGVKFLVASYAIAPIIGFQFVFMSTFQALGKSIPSLVLSLSRQGIAFIPTILIGTKLFGINGIIWSQPIADIVSVALATVMYIYIYKKMKRKALEEENNNSEPAYANV